MFRWSSSSCWSCWNCWSCWSIMLTFDLCGNFSGSLMCFCLISLFLFFTGLFFFFFNLLLSLSFFSLVLLLFILHDILFCFLVIHKRCYFLSSFCRHWGVVSSCFNGRICFISFVFDCLKSFFDICFLLFLSFTYILSYSSLFRYLFLLLKIFLVINLLLSLFSSLLNILFMSQRFFTLDVKLVFLVQLLGPCIFLFSKIS